MSSVTQMIQTHPGRKEELERQLTEALEAASACAQVCRICADACLGEQSVDHLRTCIRTDLDCADICAATAAVLSRQAGSSPTLVQAVLEACRTACSACAAECEQHAEMHEHCRICAEACRRCEQACTDLLAALT